MSEPSPSPPPARSPLSNTITARNSVWEQTPADCLPCRILGAAAFIGLGGYSYYQGMKQVRQDVQQWQHTQDQTEQYQNERPNRTGNAQRQQSGDTYIQSQHSNPNRTAAGSLSHSASPANPSTSSSSSSSSTTQAPFRSFSSPHQHSHAASPTMAGPFRGSRGAGQGSRIPVRLPLGLRAKKVSVVGLSVGMIGAGIYRLLS